jgi:hypothetical protein
MLSRWKSKAIAVGVVLSLVVNLSGSQGAAFGATKEAGLRESISSTITASLSIYPNWTYDDPSQVGGGVGYAVSAAGDVNGDGYGDVIIGADKYMVTVDAEGAAFGFYGSARGLAEDPDWLVGGGIKGHAFGNAVSSAGDVNGDGYDDILVGAYLYKEQDLKLPDEGAAFLYYGSEDGLSLMPGWKKLSGQREAQFGYAVNSAGDVNADGYNDVIIGARYFEGPENVINEGAAFVYYGSGEGLSDNADWVAFGGLPSAGFGSAVASAGDINQDGYDDVIIGAPGAFNGWGMVSLYLGSETGLQDEVEWTVVGSSNASFGRSVALAGDVNADGCDDVIIGAPYADSGIAQDVGGVFLYLGSPEGLGGQPTWQTFGTQFNERFGFIVSSAGDINLDGFADVLVSAPAYTDGQQYEGAVYVYSGSSSGLNTFPNWWAYGNKAEAYFGYALSSAGDVNRDGLVDLIVGTPEYKLETNIVGRAFVYLGWTINYSSVYLPLVIKAGSE